MGRAALRRLAVAAVLAVAAAAAWWLLRGESPPSGALREGEGPRAWRASGRGDAHSETARDARRPRDRREGSAEAAGGSRAPLRAGPAGRSRAPRPRRRATEHAGVRPEDR